MSSKQPAAPSSSATPHSGENSAPSSAESHRNAMAAGGVRERSFADTSAGQVTLVSDRREEGEGSAEAEPRGAIRQGVTPEKSLPNFGGMVGRAGRLPSSGPGSRATPRPRSRIDLRL